MLDVIFLLLFVGLAGVVLWASRSLATGLVTLAFGTAMTGSALALWGIPGWTWTYRNLQIWLALGLAITAAYAWFSNRAEVRLWPRSRLLVALAPTAFIAVILVVSRFMAADAGGPLAGVGYLITHPIAEDNAKWLNATAQLATGNNILADYAVGTPLMMLMVFSATVVSVASVVLYGGVNQVAVAADTLILTQHLLVLAAPLALIPLATATWSVQRRRRARPSMQTKQQVPALALWAGMGVLVTASILLTRYGHLTLQFTLIILTLWVATFLAPRSAPRLGLIATLTVAACSQVWFPLNVLATSLLLSALLLTSWRALSSARRRAMPDLIGPLSVLFLTGTMFYYLRSSIDFTVGVSITGSSTVPTTAAGEASAPLLPLFSIGGGTETATPLLLVLLAISLLGAASLLERCLPQRSGHQATWKGLITAMEPLLPAFVLLGYAAAVALFDFWAIGSGPGYGSKKLAFAVTVVVLTATIPVALTRLDLGKRGTTPLRLAAVAVVGFLLVADNYVPRALAEVRPQMWPKSSNLNLWAPAEVRPTANQPLSEIPIGCVYLTSQHPAPSALPKGQVAYSCTRLLTSLAGLEPSTGTLREWLQTEWGSNKPLWNDYYLRLVNIHPQRSVILLDANGSSTGTMLLGELLQRYPPTALPQ